MTRVSSAAVLEAECCTFTGALHTASPQGLTNPTSQRRNARVKEPIHVARLRNDNDGSRSTAKAGKQKLSMRGFEDYIYLEENK
jgi:hypothetical protein